MTERDLEILVVDDDALDVMNVKRAFAKNSLTNRIHEAKNGIEALELLRKGTLPPRHLVLLDLNMPRMNGIEFLRALRADPALRSTSVVVLTTSSEERDKADAYAFNVAGYLLKPVAFASFVDMMATLNKYWTQAELP